MRTPLAVLTAVFLLSTNAHALPATTIQVENNSDMAAETKPKSWFVNADTASNLRFNGLKSIGLGAGKHFDHIFVDVAFKYIWFPYPAVRVHQTGVIHPESVLPAGAEITRDRQGVNGRMLTMGPGVGFIYKLFGSKRWFETARFGLNYVRYSEYETKLSFIGALANLQGGVGYRFDPFLVSMNIAWNLGYIQRVHNSENPRLEIEHNNFLPVQWWALQVSGMFFVF